MSRHSAMKRDNSASSSKTLRPILTGRSFPWRRYSLKVQGLRQSFSAACSMFNSASIDSPLLLSCDIRSSQPTCEVLRAVDWFFPSTMLDPGKSKITTFSQKNPKKLFPPLLASCAVAAYYRPLRVMWRPWGNVGTPLPMRSYLAYYPLGEEQGPPRWCTETTLPRTLPHTEHPDL